MTTTGGLVMTSSCAIRGGDPEGVRWASRHYSLQLGWVYLRAILPANLGGWTSDHLWNRPFLHKKTPFLESKRALSSVFWAFFDLGTSLAEPDLLKTGPKLNLVAGGSLEVIESTSFPSPTGPQEVPRTPGDLPAGLPRSFGNTCIFFNFWWRHLWVTCNLLALSRSRFAGAGEGSQCLMVS